MEIQQLKIGHMAPDFELSDQDSRKHTLAMYKGMKVVLYFYPRDDTPGCTMEAKGLKNNFDKFRKAGIAVLGVSTDSVESHHRFAQKYALPFTLLSDEEHIVIEKYGAWQRKFPGIMATARMTFIIDEQGKIIKVYPKVKPAEHAEEILSDLLTLSK